MRVRVPLPFADVEINVRGNRANAAMAAYVILSVIFHLTAIIAALFFAVRPLLPDLARKPPMEMVTISTAARIEHRPRPEPAHAPRTLASRRQPRPVRVAVARAPRRAEPVRQTPPPLKMPVRRTTIAFTKSAAEQAENLQAQTRAFERTIAQARAANDPVAGAVARSVQPAAQKRSSFNVQGDFGRPVPEGVLYPLKRWVDGGWVYYYVRYDAEYADGSTESGVVPWPIRFPETADPFARGRQRMPLPGPMSDYVASADVAMSPLVKNCYDHRYEYCPIEHE